MRFLLPLLSVAGVVVAQAATMDESWKDAKNIYQFTADDIDGNPVHLAKYAGHVCIVVNVATN
jgi:hypothetical protein